MVEQPKRLYRSRTDRTIRGVLGGAAEYFDADPSMVRIVYSVAAFFTGCIPGILLYSFLAIFVPLAPEPSPQTPD